MDRALVGGDGPLLSPATPLPDLDAIAAALEEVSPEIPEQLAERMFAALDQANAEKREACRRAAMANKRPRVRDARITARVPSLVFADAEAACSAAGMTLTLGVEFVVRGHVIRCRDDGVIGRLRRSVTATANLTRFVDARLDALNKQEADELQARLTPAFKSIRKAVERIRDDLSLVGSSVGLPHVRTDVAWPVGVAAARKSALLRQVMNRGKRDKMACVRLAPDTVQRFHEIRERLGLNQSQLLELVLRILPEVAAPPSDIIASARDEISKLGNAARGITGEIAERQGVHTEQAKALSRLFGTLDEVIHRLSAAVHREYGGRR